MPEEPQAHHRRALFVRTKKKGREGEREGAIKSYLLTLTGSGGLCQRGRFRLLTWLKSVQRNKRTHAKPWPGTSTGAVQTEKLGCSPIPCFGTLTFGVSGSQGFRSVREHCSPNSDEKCIEHATKCSARSPEQPNKAGPFTVQPNTRKNIEWGRPVPKAPEQP